MSEKETATAMGKHVYNLQIRVLIYQEDGEFCAHALEMDLLAYGKDFKTAILELTESIYQQISFAKFKNDDALLLFPAEKCFFDRWEAAHAAALKHEVFPDQSGEMEVLAVCITLDQKRIKAPKRRFDPVEISNA
jgi:hypothetical protein